LSCLAPLIPFSYVSGSPPSHTLLKCAPFSLKSPALSFSLKKRSTAAVTGALFDLPSSSYFPIGKCLLRRIFQFVFREFLTFLPFVRMCLTPFPSFMRITLSFSFPSGDIRVPLAEKVMSFFDPGLFSNKLIFLPCVSFSPLPCTSTSFQNACFLYRATP